MMGSSNLLPAISNFDPLANFLRNILRLDYIKYGILMLVANIAVDLWIGIKYDVFVTNLETPGLLQDFTALATDLVMNPIVAGLYLWSTTGTTTLYRKLNNSSVFEWDENYEKAIDNSRSLYAKRITFYVVLILAFLLTAAQVLALFGILPWKTIGGYIDLFPAISFARAPFWFLTFYALFFAIFNVAITITTLRRLFRTEDIRLVPLHPDNCGGLGSISQYTTKIAYGIGAIGLMVSAATIYELQNGSLSEAIPVMLGIIGYVLLAPILFFLAVGNGS